MDVKEQSTSKKTALPDAEMFLRLVKLLWNERKTIIVITVIVTVLATAYAFIMPQKFSSYTTILPPKKEERSFGLMDMLSSGGGQEMFDFGATLGLGGRGSDIFVKILESRTVADSLILNHGLAELFGIPSSVSWRFATRPLAEATTIEAAKDGTITLIVTLATGYFASDEEIDRIKLLAADLTNSYVRYLDSVNREKLVSTAKNTRLFIQEHIATTKADLDSAYGQLVAYQEKNKALMIDKQMDALVSAAGALKMQLTQVSTELALAERDLRSDSRTVMELQARLTELQKQYDKLREGQSSDGDFVLAFMKLPKVARDLSLLVRRVKILEEVNAYLNKQYFKERIQEARDLPTVQVLDPAIPAIQRTAPKRMQWMLTSLVAGFLASIVFVLIRVSVLRFRLQHPRS